jgi:3-dehydroquinate synthase
VITPSDFRHLSAPVRLEWQHRLYVTRDVFRRDNPTLLHALGDNGPSKPRVAVFVDEGVRVASPGLDAGITAWMAHHKASLELVAGPSPVAGGEIGKNDPATFEAILAEILRARLCRHSFIIAIGGGAMLDVTGFAAATAHRGIPLVRIPTTSLAQADSGVGVKNALNHFGRKNWLGAFAVPWAVINDGAFLETLPPRERSAGLIEAVKVALIRDGAFYEWLEANAEALVAGESSVIDEAVERSAVLHFAHITQNGDPFEHGSSRPLDFGHWAAHKLEQLTDFAIGHAAAVAIGMALDLEYAARTHLLPAAEAARFQRLIRRLGFSLFHPRLEDDRLVEGLEEFREHLGGTLTIPMVVAAGEKIDVHEMDTSVVRASIAHLQELSAS